MASGAISGYSFVTFTGELVPSGGITLEEITRPGVVGVAYRQVGKRGDPFTVQTLVDVASAASAQTLIRGYKALQGTVVPVIDGIGNAWPYVLVMGVRPNQPKYAAAMQGGLSGSWTGYLIECTWTLQIISATG